MIAAVAFDLDSTLYDHGQFVRGAYADVARAAEAAGGVPAGPFLERILADWRRLGSRANTIFRDALRDFGAAADGLEQRLVQAYRDHRPALLPYPGVRAGLARLRRRGLRLGLLSDGQGPVQRRKLEALGLGALFHAVVVTGELGPAFYKPHPAGFERLAERLGTHPASIAYVGDNPLVDFAPARRLGMRTIRVRTPEYLAEPGGGEWIDREFDRTSRAIAWVLADHQGKTPS